MRCGATQREQAYEWSMRPGNEILRSAGVALLAMEPIGESVAQLQL
jgi:hypothetical protein